MLLEDLEGLSGMLLARSAILRSLDEQDLRQARVLAERHAQAGEQLQAAWTDASAQQSAIGRIGAALAALADAAGATNSPNYSSVRREPWRPVDSTPR